MVEMDPWVGDHGASIVVLSVLLRRYEFLLSIPHTAFWRGLSFQSDDDDTFSLMPIVLVSFNGVAYD